MKTGVEIDCEICGRPGKKRGTRGILCDTHDVRVGEHRQTVGRKLIHSIGGSLTVETPHVRDGRTPPPIRAIPDGYIRWSQYCAKHGRQGHDYATYRKLLDLGLAELFRGDRIVRADAPWPTRKNYKETVK